MTIDRREIILGSVEREFSDLTFEDFMTVCREQPASEVPHEGHALIRAKKAGAKSAVLAEKFGFKHPRALMRALEVHTRVLNLAIQRDRPYLL
ncbi:hypothetical protein SEA_ESPICA_54 [Rhodococcus phage Espica]|nr:hypothetical protein SEA_SHUMAN_54 [Rhodococcus phage Shuman]QBI96216.1 hypothetical protein SEA_ESPICA_54 [Rhodococcus phage Espica]QBI96870.1 hypothetical protein SEA_BELENARIA_54 [Rhodococcus phage Belenaria]